MPSTAVSEIHPDAYWMPFTANRRYKRAPVLFSAAEGMHYIRPDGSRVLDGIAGLWCVNAGHRRPEIVDAISRTAHDLDYAPSFQMSHPLAFELAQALCDEAPEGFTQVFFSNSGSEAVDTALKIALGYHRARGEGQRVRLIDHLRALFQRLMPVAQELGTADMIAALRDEAIRSGNDSRWLRNQFHRLRELPLVVESMTQTFRGEACATAPAPEPTAVLRRRIRATSEPMHVAVQPLSEPGVEPLPEHLH